MRLSLRWIVVVLVALSTTACSIGKRTASFGRFVAGNIELGATAGAGFAGLRNVEVQERAAFATCGSCADSLLVDTVIIGKNDFRQWRPALSTGLVAYLRSDLTRLGGGLGTHIVFVPDSEGRTSPYPAITLHLGNPENEVFFGMVLSATDVIDLPKEGRRVARRSDGDYSSFYLGNAGRSSHFYIGIQIKGTRQSQSDADRATLRNQEFGSITTDPATMSLAVAETKRLSVTVLDTRNRPFMPALNFTSANPSVASVDALGNVTGVAAGETTITVHVMGTAHNVSVTVTDPEGDET